METERTRVNPNCSDNLHPPPRMPAANQQIPDPKNVLLVIPGGDEPATILGGGGRKGEPKERATPNKHPAKC